MSEMKQAMKSEYIPYKDVVFRLRGYVVDEIESTIYPQFNLTLQEEIIFHTLHEAEEKIRNLVKQRIDSRYCFFIYEVPIGVECIGVHGQRVRSYSSNGELISESKASSLYDVNGNLESFNGRDVTECHFKIGDTIEVFHYDCIKTEVVDRLPIDSNFIKTDISVNADYTDDCYLTLTDNGHNHPPVWHCFHRNSIKHIDYGSSSCGN